MALLGRRRLSLRRFCHRFAVISTVMATVPLTYLMLDQLSGDQGEEEAAGDRPGGFVWPTLPDNYDYNDFGNDENVPVIFNLPTAMLDYQKDNKDVVESPVVNVAKLKPEDTHLVKAGDIFLCLVIFSHGHGQQLARLMDNLYNQIRFAPSNSFVFVIGDSVVSDVTSRFHVQNTFKITTNDTLKSLNMTVNTCRYSLILHEDMVLSEDAYLTVQRGIELLQVDQNLFTLSLANDNAFKWCASNDTFFARTDHFSQYGWILSRAKFLYHLLPSWKQDLELGDNVQRMMRAQKLTSLRPEVPRSKRLVYFDDSLTIHRLDRRVELGEVQSFTWGSPSRHTTTHHRLHHSNYDTLVMNWYLDGAVRLNHVMDVGYYVGTNERCVYADCEDQKDLHRIVTIQFGLFGEERGIVRGSYKDSLIVRPFGVPLTIVCQSSPFYHRYKRKWRSRELVVSDDNTTGETVGTLAHGGLTNLVHQSTFISANRPRLSCRDACAVLNQTCDILGLYALNYDCPQTRAFLPATCTLCRHLEDDRLPTFPHLDTSTSTCFTGSRKLVNCDSSSSLHVRLCVCRKVADMVTSDHSRH